MELTGGGIRNGILNLALKDVKELYEAYMPFVRHGGLFIPSRHSYHLGEEIFFMLDLMDEPEKIPLSGQVIWVTPRGLGSHRRQGIGVQLDEQQAMLMDRIETYLAGMIGHKASTHTM